MDHARALVEQNRLLGEIVADADPSRPVPTCPGWTVRQLVTHVGRGDRWAATIVGQRSDVYVDIRTVADGSPPADDVVGWLGGSAQALLDAVEKVGADTPVWSFMGPQRAQWWIRRRLHEATVHRADAAHAVGRPYELDLELAADGIEEWLGLLAARQAREVAPLEDGGSLHLHATDEGRVGEWTIRGEGGRVVWESGHTKCDVAVRGRAVDLLLGMYRRPAGDLEVLGDAAVWTTWLERTDF